MTYVPCNGCRRCCIDDTLILHPEMGDEVSAYETVPVRHPMTGRPVHMLAQKDNGECIYLTADGCGIHDRKPAICREYDCRRQYLMMTKAERKAAVRAGYMCEEKFSEGKKRAHTLTGPERLECFRRRDERRRA